jgi:hypothetical protein
MQQSNGFTAFSLVASSCQIVTPLCLVAQLVERKTVNFDVAGSSPAEAATVVYTQHGVCPYKIILAHLVKLA